ncbi:hypothetical protein LTR82_011658 [Friedmanniomyces endolithicus]|uniref:Putative lipoate-protein ligase A n=1 Tax=Friedmanniomyces endolithicus TaxID=329885 RepID=A0AAN6FF55_9PEZI|nr:hypothetical protein LTR82_011658 [Friedmanniomyces endolithicus]
MITLNRACRRARGCQQLLIAHRRLSQSALDRLAQPVQSYISTSRDPYLNLSVEHYLLQKSAPESTILLLYVNRPSIVIGRNQNPWLEVNLALLNPSQQSQPETESPGLGNVDLVRRRSGGGTVFHDEGNVNWTVICPPKAFTRDKHAEMVVRALRSCGVERSRVNERHDIVLDQGERIADVDLDNTHITPYTRHAGLPEIRPLKVSGSAYKLTRQRALHHGTCLLSSPNLNIIPDYLHSPAKPHITARGVESVSSPVGNILLSNEHFIDAVRSKFSGKYRSPEGTEHIEVGEDWLDHEPVRQGYEELKSREWTFLQTPQFTISTSADPSCTTDVELTVRNGAISGGHLRHRGGAVIVELNAHSIGQRVNNITSWPETLSQMFTGVDCAEGRRLGAWFERMLPVQART